MKSLARGLPPEHKLVAHAGSDPTPTCQDRIICMSKFADVELGRTGSGGHVFNKKMGVNSDSKLRCKCFEKGHVELRPEFERAGLLRELHDLDDELHACCILEVNDSERWQEVISKQNRKKLKKEEWKHIPERCEQSILKTIPRTSEG